MRNTCALSFALSISHSSDVTAGTAVSHSHCGSRRAHCQAVQSLLHALSLSAFSGCCLFFSLPGFTLALENLDPTRNLHVAPHPSPAVPFPSPSVERAHNKIYTLFARPCHAAAFAGASGLPSAAQVFARRNPQQRKKR